MLVDDEVAVIGSANINDRSLLGHRDSELNVIIKDDVKKIPLVINNKEVLVSQFVHSLRIRLMREHLGFNLDSQNTEPCLLDPSSDELFNLFKSRAKENTTTYESIFGYLVPSDYILTFKELEILEKAQTRSDNKQVINQKYLEQSLNIKGNVVEFPLEFLKDQSIRMQKLHEVFIPIKNYL